MIIDVHAHFVPPSMLENLEDQAGAFGVSLAGSEPGCRHCVMETGLEIRPFFQEILDVDMRLAAMDEQQVDREILSLWADLFAYELPVAKGAAWHRHMNNHLAGVAEKWPERFSWLSSGPLQDANAAARELERTAGMEAVGTIVATELRGGNLGEADLDEFWAACVSLRMPVFLHPSQPAPGLRSRRFALAQICAYTFDTTLTVGSMISAGVLDRFPGLEIIVSHGGGLFPWLAGRFDRMYRAAPSSTTGTVALQTPSYYLPRLHYDTILHDSEALQFLAGKVGVERILLGSDLPFPPADPDPLGSLRDASFNDEDIRRITEINPVSLFGL